MKAKRLPRLWCAMQGLLPLEACRVAELGELAWPRETEPEARLGVARRVPRTRKGKKG